MRKNKTTKNFINFKMTDEVYKLRKKVINVLYDLKNNGFNRKNLLFILLYFISNLWNKFLFLLKFIKIKIYFINKSKQFPYL